MCIFITERFFLISGFLYSAILSSIFYKSPIFFLISSTTSLFLNFSINFISIYLIYMIIYLYYSYFI